MELLFIAESEENDDSPQLLANYQQLIAAIPTEHQNLLNYVLELLVLVMDNSEENKVNYSFLNIKI